MRRIVIGGAACAAVACAAFASARAWDDADGTALTSNPAADIASVYAWMSSDRARVELVLTASSFATAGATFPSNVDYAFHVRSQASHGASSGTDRDIICRFDADQTIHCWAGDPSAPSYVTGDASATAGIASADGRLRVFAGLRADPFFHNRAGLNDFVSTYTTAATGLTFDAEGCPAISGATSATLATMLQSTSLGAQPSVNAYASSNVLAIVLSVDRTLLDVGGPILGVHASTHVIP